MRDKPLRTLLFAPANDESKLRKLATFGADVVVLDLEDAVADAEKTGARTSARAALDRYGPNTVAAVRVNAIETGRLEDDIAAVVGPGLSALLVPKVEDTQTLTVADALITQHEQRTGIQEGSVALLALVETARGVARCEEIAASGPPRLATLIFGLGDFAADLGIDLTLDAMELLYARSRVVVAARAAGLAPPIDGPYLRLRDVDGLIEDTKRSRQLGFQGRVVVYPPQVEPIKRVFSLLTPEEEAAARQIVEAFRAAEADGCASIQVDGRFVDYPIYRRELRKLEMHASTGAPHD